MILFICSQIQFKRVSFLHRTHNRKLPIWNGSSDSVFRQISGIRDCISYLLGHERCLSYKVSRSVRLGHSGRVPDRELDLRVLFRSDFRINLKGTRTMNSNWEVVDQLAFRLSCCWRARDLGLSSSTRYSWFHSMHHHRDPQSCSIL